MYPDFAADGPLDDAARHAIRLLAGGGDARIALDPLTGVNRYLSGPYPRAVLAYASSTANDMSRPAFARAVERAGRADSSYDAALDELRERLRAAYDLDERCAIAFAASGTDLEYVALAAVSGRARGGVHNILLGAAEVGSGCIHSAHGRYFAGETPRGAPSTPGEPVAGLERVSLADIPVRCAEGQARTSGEIAAALDAELARASAEDRHALVHVVHGSKTGLVLPDLADIDRLRACWGDRLSLVVDACQARITAAAIHDYLARGAIVFLTGSKFMGGPPFNGFALIPREIVLRAPPPSAGLATIFRRAEWPLDWQGRDALPDEGNPGLALRLDASIFELERFAALGMPAAERVIGAFEREAERLAKPLGLALVQPFAPGESAERRSHPLEMRTLVTLDVSAIPGARTFEEARALHRRMALAGVRLGQPVKCARLPEGGWGGTLRIGLSMPQVSEFAALDDRGLAARFAADTRRFAAALAPAGH